MKLWQFYVAFGLQFFELAKYGVIRSLLSKCVHKDETGKMFSALAVIAAIVPMISFPAVRLLYNETLDTFPAAEILLSASILIVGTLVNFLIYTQRWRIASFTSQNDVDPKAAPSIANAYSKNDNYQLQQLSSL